ncbi:sporulation protein YabP [Agathobaculum sp.]|uniref:sporulation protein YabP n=1 Tax=Agathobaculum sp. TaxID=2048138 RepID=UPI002A7EFAA7|nr:sporulation protein YabP [Agathobaculum sp.]MDY3617900.1 sporulation protein YabP [Agathobaculum sp.]
MAGEERMKDMPHTIILEGREKLSVSGVIDVQSFDEEQVLLETVRGMLVVRGQGLHVERLQLEAGELIVEGEVGCLEYDDSVQPRGGWLSRLFGR